MVMVHRIQQHKLFILVLAIALAGAAPLAAAPPFGFFDGPADGGNAGAGVIPLTGWALDDDGVVAVDITVDGLTAGRAGLARERPLVSLQFPGFPDSDAPGFGFQLDTTQYLNGLHTVQAKVISGTGEVFLLNPVVLEFTNLTHNLVPFGQIQFPQDDAELFGTCDLEDPDRRLAVVDGFALDVGVETGDQGVGYVELLLDGSIIANSETSCVYDVDLGGFSNCYGLRRLDIARTHPTLTNSNLSGFRFVLDVGVLLNSGWVPGQHVLTIRSGDISGQVANIDEIPVFFACDEFFSNDASFGRVDRPRPGLIYNGVVEVTGWALDWEGVGRVLVFVDGSYAGDATFGIHRPGVGARYPGYPDSAGPGWTFALDTTAYSDGPHQVQVIIEDLDIPMQQTLIGQRDVVFFNP
jgi:hypothetical protein